MKPLAREVQIGARRLPLDLWLVLACCGVMVVLCGYAAQTLLRPGFDVVGAGDFGFVFGWALIVLGLAFVSLGYAYTWVGMRMLARDPVGRWTGVALGATVVLSFLLQHDQGARGTALTLVILVNVALLVLCGIGPGIRAGERAGKFAQVPLPIALSLVISRAEAAAVLFVGASVFPVGKYEGKFLVYGVALVGLGVAVFVAARRLLDVNKRAAYLVAGLVALNGVVALVAQRSQLSFVTFGLALVVVWGLLGHPSSRAFYGLPPVGARQAGAWSAPPPPPGAQPLAAQVAAPAPSVSPVAPMPAPPVAAVPLNVQPVSPAPLVPDWFAQAPTPPPPAFAEWAAPAAPIGAAPPTAATSLPSFDLAPPPVAEPPTAAWPTPVLGVPVREDLEEQTVARATLPPAANVLRLRVAGRSDITVDVPVVLGRSPTRIEEEPTARREVLPDPSKSLSRSHLLVLPSADGLSLQVRDLGSTNGSWILDGEATTRQLSAGVTAVVPVGGVLILGGDVSVEVVC